MYVVRPVELADIGALEALAAVPMPGVHTLPKTREKILAMIEGSIASFAAQVDICLLYTSPSPRDATLSRMPSSA